MPLGAHVDESRGLNRIAVSAFSIALSISTRVQRNIPLALDERAA
jgi:hypothetical protein